MMSRGSVIVTSSYMAPEQAQGERVDARCDLYSLGCVLYRMSTGKMPQQNQNAAALLTDRAPGPSQSPRELNPAVFAELSDLVMQLLAKDREERPASARTVREQLAALERVRAGDQASQTAPQPPARQQTGPGRVASPASTRPAQPPLRPVWQRRLPFRFLGAAVVAMLLLGAGLAGSARFSQVVRIATNRGQLVILAEDPDTNVIVKESVSGAVLARTTQHEMELKAGVYEIELWNREGGLRLSTQQVRIMRGGQVVVTAWPEPSKSR
jgi:hypothetical protein